VTEKLCETLRKVKILKNRVILVTESKITLAEAPPSRFIYIAKALLKKKFEVEVLGRKGDKLEGLKTHQISGSKHVSRMKILTYAYAKTVSQSYDTIIVRGSLLAFLLLPLKIPGKKIILDFHGWLFREIEFFYEKTLYNKLKAAFYRLAERISIAHSDAIICVSKGIRDSLRQKERAKSIVLENGIDLNESKAAVCEAKNEKEKIYSTHHISKEKPFLGFLGNWERQLDMETMFKGAELAEVDLVVIGEGPKLNMYRKTWSNAKFLGKLPKLDALKITSLCEAGIAPYKKAYATTSYWSQRKVKDYLSLGRPIIMADVTEREAYLAPNKHVLLYEPGNARDLADKIRTIVSDKKLREEMSGNNLILARLFDWQVLVEQSGLIEKILKN
jgi:glycosyltransferase involved in cell wall biosynthesis